MNASFEERSVWIQLVSVAAVLGTYFVVASMMLSRGVMALPAYVPLFVGSVVLLVVVLVAGHIVAAISTRPDGQDERDRLIGWRAESNSSWILGVGVFIGLTCLVLDLPDVWTANVLMLSLMVSEIVRFTMQLVYYRRGW